MSDLRADLLALDRTVGTVPALEPEQLGSASFRETYGARFAYVAGSMAGGIASVDFVRALGSAGILASFGAAGVALDEVERAADALRRALPSGPWAMNLIHTPGDPARERALAELYAKTAVPAVEASAFMEITPALVFLRAASIRGPRAAPVRLLVKLSNPALAGAFLAPPPRAMLDELVAAGRIGREQAEAAGRAPLADAITVEADSAGHTDNRALLVILPEILALRRSIQRNGPRTSIGAAGGIGTPAAAAAAFALGAEYVVTGSINQACVESGTSAAVKRMLAAPAVDVMMAPAADMFELGVNVQVLKTGTLFPMRARSLRRLYEQYESLEAIPPPDRARLERDLFRMPIAAVWDETRAYLREREPALLEEARTNARTRMALTFRWYLGRSWRWASSGSEDRTTDFQVWCGPAMAAFNAWTRGTRLEAPEARRAAEVAEILMRGAAYLTRVQWLRAANGGNVDDALFDVTPDELVPARPVPPIAATNGDAKNDDEKNAEPRDVRGWLSAQIAAHLSIPEDEIDPNQPFANFALDSAAAVLIMARLEKYLGRPLSPTLVWNYPTIETLAAHLEGAAV